MGELGNEFCYGAGVDGFGGEGDAGGEVGGEVGGDEDGGGVEEDDVAAGAAFAGEDGGEDAGVGAGVAARRVSMGARVRPTSSGVRVERVTIPLWTSATWLGPEMENSSIPPALPLGGLR